jgi:hypothetical protein
MSPQNAHQKDEHNQCLQKGTTEAEKQGFMGCPWHIFRTVQRCRLDSSITTNFSEKCVASVFRTEQYNYVVRHLVNVTTDINRILGSKKQLA